MSHDDIPEWIDQAALAAPVARLLRVGAAVIERWTGKQLFRGAGDQLGVWHVSGVATGANGSQRWSLFLKAWAPVDEESLPSHWNWPHREAAAYRSGLLETMPDGVAAPRLLDELVRPDGTLWLWLEDVAGDTDAVWPIARDAEAARHLGKWNGAYLVGNHLPNQDWLSRNWLRQWVEAASSGMATLVGAREHPTIRQAFPPGSIEAFSRIWDDRHARLDALEALPKTFGHLDAFRRNLFFREQPNGVEEVVAIDWGFCGIASIGEELAPLVAASVAFMEVPATHIRQLEREVVDGYINGLRDAGWNGNADQVWMGYANAVVLRYGVGSHRVLLPWLLDAENHRRLEQTINKPIDDLIQQFRLVHERLAELSVEVCHGRRST